MKYDDNCQILGYLYHMINDSRQITVSDFKKLLYKIKNATIKNNFFAELDVQKKIFF